MWAEPTCQSVGTNQRGQNLRANQWGPTSVGRTYVPISGDQPAWGEPTCQSVGTNLCGQNLRANQWGPTSVGRTYVPISGDQPVCLRANQWGPTSVGRTYVRARNVGRKSVGTNQCGQNLYRPYACIYCRTSVQRNSKYCIVSKKFD